MILTTLEFIIPPSMKICMLWGLATWSVVRIIAFHLFGLGRVVWRYFSLSDLVGAVKVSLLGSAVAAAILIVLCPVYFPRSVLVINAVISLLLTVGVRAIPRMLFELASRGTPANGKRTLIYGAGAAGI